MKKDFLLIAAAATMLTACVNTEDFRDHNIQQDSVNDGSIDFVPFAEKLTKAENSSALYTQSFKAHHDDFAVWGFKTGTNAGQVFGSALVTGTPKTSTTGTIVTVGGDVAAPTYTYSPKRFWDKSASGYYFYAVAPAKINNTEWATFNEGTTANTTGYFTATGVTLNAANLNDLDATTAAAATATGKPEDALQNNFKKSGDIDRLIAAPCEVSPNRYNVSNPDKVHLNFIHILSKLNISIKKAASLNDFTVTLKEFGVYYIPGTGDFDESKANANGTAMTTRWDLTPYETSSVYDVTKKINYLALEKNSTYKTSGLAVTGDAQYIIESLVIPQNISYERVALNGGSHDATDEVAATYFTDYALYAAARPKEAPELDETVFANLITKLFTVSGTAPNLTYTLKSENDVVTNDYNQDAWKADLKKIEKTPYKPQVTAYTAVANTSQPYFMIKYTITGGSGETEYTETFTSYYNLVAAFKNYDNDGHLSDGTTAIPEANKTLAFNEGWQNTLNITIKPTAIEFTADVAEWADTYNPSPIYEVK